MLAEHPKKKRAALLTPPFSCDPDFGDKRITVNAIAPGGIKTDMYVEAARKYIPGSENFSDEKVDEVSFWFSSLSKSPAIQKRGC